MTLKKRTGYCYDIDKEARLLVQHFMQKCSIGEILLVRCHLNFMNSVIYFSDNIIYLDDTIS